MGLAERRAAKDFETNTFPGLKKEIEDAAGFALPIAVDWETLTTDGQASLYADSWTKVYFTPLRDALKAICIDEMGREALKKGVQKVVITNKEGIYYGDRMAKLEAGVLTLDHQPTTNVDDVKQRTEGIQKMLENAL